MSRIIGLRIIKRVVLKNNLYVCHAEPYYASVNASASSVIDNKYIIWHNRLGHMSDIGVDILHKLGHFGSDILPPHPFM